MWVGFTGRLNCKQNEKYDCLTLLNTRTDTKFVNEGPEISMSWVEFFQKTSKRSVIHLFGTQE